MHKWCMKSRQQWSFQFTCPKQFCFCGNFKDYPHDRSTRRKKKCPPRTILNEQLRSAHRNVYNAWATDFTDSTWELRLVLPCMYDNRLSSELSDEDALSQLVILQGHTAWQASLRHLWWRQPHFPFSLDCSTWRLDGVNILTVRFRYLLLSHWCWQH